MLACRSIDFAYGKLQVLFDVSFTLSEGEMVAALHGHWRARASVPQLQVAKQPMEIVGVEAEQARGIEGARLEAEADCPVAELPFLFTDALTPADVAGLADVLSPAL